MHIKNTTIDWVMRNKCRGEFKMKTQEQVLNRIGGFITGSVDGEREAVSEGEGEGVWGRESGWAVAPEQARQRDGLQLNRQVCYDLSHHCRGKPAVPCRCWVAISTAFLLASLLQLSDDRNPSRVGVGPGGCCSQTRC